MRRIISLTIVSTFFLVMGFSNQLLSSSLLPPDAEKTVLKGTVSIVKKQGVTIHSYTSPLQGALVNTHIVESKNKLVIVDAQFLRPYAKEMAEYVKGLGKPVDRIIISHSHPDHWFGLEYFQGVPVYTTEETKNEIAQSGDKIIQKKKTKLGDLILSEKVVPDHIISENRETIDGVTYIFKKIQGAEAENQLLIMLPDQKVMIAQDIVYNKVHFFTGNKSIVPWMTTLKDIQHMDGYDLILAGHGSPFCGKDVVRDDLQYLTVVKAILESAKTSSEFKDELVRKFPDYDAPNLIDISTGIIFKK